ncbi:MAG: Rne/Rng family ribonuclease [Cyanobacteria bacterium]|nr:Rne/Rng family ribonuclease [Cyanobacteriota bacterium]
MPQQIVIAEQLRIAAVLTDERVDELVVAQGRYQIGDVYLGTVENVLPGIDAAFVNIGESEKNGFIHITDLGPLRLKKGGAGITELLEPRQKVLVQVMKEPTGSKGPRLTGNLALPGRFLVLQPHGQGVNISRRINGENERNRLRALGVLIKPPGAGLLIRTEAEGVSEDLLIDDLESLLRQWEAIQQAAETASPPVLLNRDEDFIHRVLRDFYGPELVRVVVDAPDAVARVKAYLAADQVNVQVEAHNEPTEILEHYKVNAAIRDALKPRVELPSGGYVIIEPTEALTVIDVNSGSFTRSANARETVLWTNCEAAVEIARQLKLRNIGGVVVIDFIDMEARRDQLQLLEHFTQAVRHDSARPQIAQLTELGLVELTRKRQGQNIYELFGRACPSCGGLGHVAVLPGRDTLQPLATVSGLVRSTTSARPDVFVPATATPTTAAAAAAAEGSGRRRRGGRGGRGADGSDAAGYGEAIVAPGLETASAERGERLERGERGADSSLRRTDHELVAVPMDSQQELVYGWLGLNPALLLDPVPSGDNLLVRVVRPGTDAETVLEEARQQLAAAGSRRRRRGRGGSEGRGDTGGDRIGDSSGSFSGSSSISSSAASVANGWGESGLADGRDSLPVVEITPLPIEIPNSVMAQELVTVEVPARRRRGSSRPVAASTAAAEAPPLAAEDAAPAAVAQEVDDAGEPRRRRRRSSASD